MIALWFSSTPADAAAGRFLRSFSTMAHFSLQKNHFPHIALLRRPRVWCAQSRNSIRRRLAAGGNRVSRWDPRPKLGELFCRMRFAGRATPKCQWRCWSDGLGHPEGPAVASGRKSCFCQFLYKRGRGLGSAPRKTTYARTGGAPNACVLGSDGSSTSRNVRRSVIGWPRTGVRLQSSAQAREGKVEIVAIEADGANLPRPTT